MTGKRGTPQERFEAKYIPEPNSGCWIWLGALSDTGRAQIHLPNPNRMRSAAQLSYELYKGNRNGLHVLHTCDNAACVNPEHLYLGTHQQNMADREARQRRRPPKGELNGRATVTEEIVTAIRQDTRWPRFIAADYGLPVSTVKKILYRFTWKHVP